MRTRITHRAVLALSLAMAMAGGPILGSPREKDDPAGRAADSSIDGVLGRMETQVPGLRIELTTPISRDDAAWARLLRRDSSPSAGQLTHNAIRPILEDEELEGRDLMIVTLWAADGRGEEAIAACSAGLRGGQVVWNRTAPPATKYARRRVGEWKAALEDWIAARFDPNDGMLLNELTYYMQLTEDTSVLDQYRARLSSWNECQGRSPASECTLCCENEEFWGGVGCDAAGYLTGIAACSISAACGPSWMICCYFSGPLASLALSTACKANVHRDAVACKRGCMARQVKGSRGE